MPDETLDKAARQWLQARGIIAAALREMVPRMGNEQAENNAAAIIARLGHAELLIAHASELKD